MSAGSGGSRTQTGLINVDFNDLCAVLRGRHEESSLASVEAQGANRSQEVLDKLAAHPFLEGGQTLADADSVLVSLAGGPDLTMAEVNRLMERINRQCENAHIIMGATIQEALMGKLSVTIVASQCGAADERARRSCANGDREPADHEKELANPPADTRPPSRYVAPAPETSAEQTQRLLTQQPSARPGPWPAKRKGSALLRQSQNHVPSKSFPRAVSTKAKPHHPSRRGPRRPDLHPPRCRAELIPVLCTQNGHR